jgi:hypothetical protein
MLKQLVMFATVAALGTLNEEKREVVLCILGGVVIAAELPGAVRSRRFDAAEKQIRRLPPSAFPDLPSVVRKELESRHCTVPQDELSSHPGQKSNVIHGALSSVDSFDWAVLCSRGGYSSVLAFRQGDEYHPLAFARSIDKNALEGLGGNRIGYTRRIAPVDPDYVKTFYRQNKERKPIPVEHQAVSDASIEKLEAIYYFRRGNWIAIAQSTIQ